MQNKSLEDIQGALQVWSAGFENTHGRKVKQSELFEYLDGLKKKKIEQSMNTQFSGLNVVEIDMVIEQVNAHSYSIEKDLAKSEKKKSK